MVDHIPKITDQSFRVHEAKDSTDDEGKKQQDQQDDDQQSDNFDKLSNKTDWSVLFDQHKLWDRNIEVKVEDIDRIKYLGLNIRSNPALLKIRVFLYDGNVINTAFLSISRSLGLTLKNNLKGSFIDVNQITADTILRLTVPKDEELVDEEITRITESKEKTFSRTFKILISKKTWMEKLGIQDPVSKRINNEILWIYLTVFIVVSALAFTAALLFV